MIKNTDICLRDERFLICLKDGGLEIWNGETLSTNIIYKYQMMGVDRGIIIEDVTNFFRCIINSDRKAIEWAASWGIEYIPRLVH